MLLRIYRIEDANGDGLYNSKLITSEWLKSNDIFTEDRTLGVNDHNPLSILGFMLMLMEQDRGLSDKFDEDLKRMRKCVRYGFDSMVSLRRWFSTEDIATLYAEGFSIVSCMVSSEHVAQLGRQVIFLDLNRAKPYPDKDQKQFFQNVGCELFPCKNTPELNCMLCFCPLYHLDCEGNFTILKNGLKDCSKCLIPHEKGYEYIFSKHAILNHRLVLDRMKEKD